MYDYDLLVIGAGSGGVRLARTAASYGAKVAIVENRYLGGSCVNVGCVPKKLFVYASQVGEHLEDAEGQGWGLDKSSINFNWQKLLSSKNQEIERLNEVYGGLLEGSGVKLIRGTAELQTPHSVKVGGQTVSAERIAIATGAWPFIPDIEGKDHIQTSNEMFYLEELPKRIVIWGGGYIGLEFAGILNGLGVETTVVFREDLVMKGFDTDVREFLTREMVKKGIKLCPNANIAKVEKSGDSLHVVLADGSEIETDMVMAATGRKPMLEGLGVENVGVELTEWGHIKVDPHFRTSVPSLYALGDVIGTPQLTPVALSQAMVLAENLFAGGRKMVEYSLIPTAVFSQPSVGSIGLTEEEALDQGYALEVYLSDFKPMKHALSGRNDRCLVKLIVQQGTGLVLGSHMVGDDAGEIIQGFAVAVKMGATKADFDRTIGIHPTSAEEFVTLRLPTRKSDKQ